MGKQSWWFGWLRRLFVCSGQTQIKRVRKWKGRVKRIEEASEEQRRYAVKVAIATAAAAEAAVAAAHAAAEIVRLTANNSFQKYSDKHLAAIRIQSAFRRYLGRKALVALKGVVKLQALIRGQLVRRRYRRMIQFYPNNLGLFHSKLQSKSQRRWIYRQDIDSLSSKTNNADFRRDRLIKYSFSHREGRNNLMVEESQPKRPQTARHRPVTKSAILDPSTPDLSPTLQVRTRSGRKQDSIEGLYSPVSCPRRSFCRTNTFDDDNNAPNSPVFPTYMATTESAKARARSTSTPRHRIGIHDSSWEHKNRRFSLCASYNGDGFSSYGADNVSQFSPYSYKLKSPFLI